MDVYGTTDSMPRGNGEAVLVVEDHTPLRRLVVRQLSDLGYHVTEAASATEALEMLEGAGTTVDLVFTDVVMAGKVDGFDLARIVAEQWPTIKVVLTSGFPDTKVNGSEGLPDGLRLLSKPYLKSNLARVVRDALDEGGTAA